MVSVVAQQFAENFEVVFTPKRSCTFWCSVAARETEAVLFNPTGAVHFVRYFHKVIAVQQLRVCSNFRAVLNSM